MVTVEVVTGVKKSPLVVAIARISVIFIAGNGNRRLALTIGDTTLVV